MDAMGWFVNSFVYHQKGSGGTVTGLWAIREQGHSSPGTNDAHAKVRHAEAIKVRICTLGLMDGEHIDEPQLGG